MHLFNRAGPFVATIRVIGCRFLRASSAVAGLALAVASAVAQTAPASTIIDVRAGDTFSAIAAQFTNDIGAWRKMYRPDLSGLPNPHLIMVGMRFEVATDSSGAKYLRVVPSGTALTAAAAAAGATGAAAAGVVGGAGAARGAVTPAMRSAGAAVAVAPAAPAPLPVTPPPARADGALVVGVLPYIAATILNPQYEYMKRYLERVDRQKVRIVVPASFKAFFDNMINGEYDIAVAAPHFARVAQLDRNMVPLGMYEPPIGALFVTPIDTRLVNARDAREMAIAFANPQSLVAMFGQQWLRQQSMEPGRDYEVKGARSDLGVGRMLLSGDAVAAIMSNGEFRALPKDESSRLKILTSFATIPNFVILAHQHLARDRTTTLKAHLKAFLADQDDGAAFARATNFSAIVDADESKLRELDAYTAATRRAMGGTK